MLNRNQIMDFLSDAQDQYGLSGILEMLADIQREKAKKLNWDNPKDKKELQCQYEKDANALEDLAQGR